MSISSISIDNIFSLKFWKAFSKSFKSIILQVQKEAYNQAIDDVLNLELYYEGDGVYFPNNEISKLKK